MNRAGAMQAGNSRMTQPRTVKGKKIWMPRVQHQDMICRQQSSRLQDVCREANGRLAGAVQQEARLAVSQLQLSATACVHSAVCQRTRESKPAVASSSMSVVLKTGYSQVLHSKHMFNCSHGQQPAFQLGQKAETPPELRNAADTERWGFVEDLGKVLQTGSREQR